MAKPKLMIFDSKSKKKLEFKPIVPGKVGMYVCGVTPYDYSHIGHARAYVAFDVLHRYLKYLGYEVKYVRNFTDIDDKIIKRANENGEDPLTLSARFSNEFLKDMAELQCLPPSVEPLVSEHMEQIKDMIAKILANGCAYVLDGDVYFSVDKFPEYGRLSGRNQDDNRAGGGGRVSVDLRKRNPADFALWKAAKPLEISWPSEWGPGRPGWHIECSAMSSQYLGHCFDIHGGGKDLIFPHHENELAQSCAACPESNINYWMHNGFVNRDNIKMSKSESNFFTIRDIIKTYHPLALRFFLMRTHYRADVNYSDRLLQNASDRVYKIYQTLHDCEKALSPYMGEDLKQKVIEQKVPGDIQKAIKEFYQGFLAKMSDDLQTTAFLDSIEPFRTVINNNLMKVKPQKGRMPPVIRGLVELEKELKDVLGIVGLMSSSTCAEVIQELKNKALERAGLTVVEVNQHICDRTEAKKVKDFTRADAIRQELKTRGIYLEDEKDGSMTWRPCEPEMQPEVQPDMVPTPSLGVPLSVGVVNGVVLVEKKSEVIPGSSSADPPFAEVVNGAALPEKQSELIPVSSSADPPSTEAVNGAALPESKSEAVNGAALPESKSEAIPGSVDAASSEVIDDATVPEKQVEMIHGSSLGESASAEVFNSTTRREKHDS